MPKADITKDPRYELVQETLQIAAQLDTQISNLITRGDSLYDSVRKYKKGCSRYLKDWLDGVKKIVKENRKPLEKTRKSFERLLMRNRELRKDGKFTSFARTLKDSMEDFEDVASICTKYRKRYSTLCKDLDIDDHRKIVIDLQMPDVEGYAGYAERYLDFHKRFTKSAKKAASLRT
jgi:hypothetical protein